MAWFFGKKRNEEVPVSNKTKVLFVTNYGKYKAGEVAEVDKSEADYLVSGCFASTNLNANIVEEKKRMEAERDKRLRESVDNAVNEIMQENKQTEKEYQKHVEVMSSIGDRLTASSKPYTDLGIRKARELVNEPQSKEIKTEPPREYIPAGADMARRILELVEEEKRKRSELQDMINDITDKSNEIDNSNVK